MLADNPPLIYTTSFLYFQVADIETAVEEIQEKIWELDKSWKNNLVFYGIRSDTLEEHPSVTESKIREIIARRMYITREIPIARCRRTNKVCQAIYHI